MGTLFIVATPIGNLEDITLRALRILREVDVIFSEDTRVTRKLLAHFDIHTPLLSYNEYASPEKTEEALERLQKGEKIALVSDAGTPAISDPGGRLVAAVAERFQNKVAVVPVPGPSALTAAASVSGFPTDSFVFMGFPPHKKGREKFFDMLAAEKRTVIFYESPHRVLKTVEALNKKLAPEREIVVCRELTKQFETITRTSAGMLAQDLSSQPVKGEYVVVVKGV